MIEIINKPLLLHLVGYLYYWQMGFNSVFKLLNHSCMYAKRGGVAAYRIVWIGLCLRSVPGVRVLASVIVTLARTL